MSVNKLIIELAKGTAKQIAPFPFDIVLLYLIEEVTQQKNEMSNLEKKLEQHMIAPFKNGLVYLEEAKYSSTKKAQRENLTEARKQFITASGVNLENYPVLPIKSTFYVGVCYDLQNDETNALRWYKRALQIAVNVLSPKENMPIVFATNFKIGIKIKPLLERVRDSDLNENEKPLLPFARELNTLVQKRGDDGYIFI